jgi:hypothetical protein
MKLIKTRLSSCSTKAQIGSAKIELLVGTGDDEDNYDGYSECSDARLTVTLLRASSGSIQPHFSIHRNGNKFVQFRLFELNHPMPFPCQLPPTARLLWVLLNGLIFPSIDLERYRPEAMGTSPANRYPLSVYLDGFAFHHLLRD